MEQWLRDALAEEQEYIICPIVCGGYVHCDEKCEKCDLYIDFMKGLENKCGKNII